MCRIILCKPQREEDKLIDHEEARTHPDITTMIGPVFTHIPMKFYYREYMLKKKELRLLILYHQAVTKSGQSFNFR